MTTRRLIHLQCDWETALQETGGKAWISCRSEGEGTLYGELKRVGCDARDLPVIEASDGFSCTWIGQKCLLVSCASRRCSTKFVAPVATFRNIIQGNIMSVSVSPSQGLGVCCGTSGQLKVFLTSNGSIRRDLSGHLLDVLCCSFFPSGVVILSGGSDMRLKIWSVEDGSCPVTLVGHKSRVTQTAIVDRGRNVVSCGGDGCVKLWDVGESKLLSNVVNNASCAINGCAIQTTFDSISLGERESQTSDREVNTEGKMLIVGREDGLLEGYGLHSRKQIFSQRLSGTVNSCAFLSDITCVAGCQDGLVGIIDLRKTSELVSRIHRSNSPILSVAAKDRNRFIASTGDGCCFVSKVLPLNSELDIVEWDDMTGADCDSVHGVSLSGNTLYTCCRDATIRKYNLI